jgi:uncharacterized membrane protein
VTFLYGRAHVKTSAADMLKQHKKTKENKKMNPYRMTAVIVGVLYIIGTVSGILSLVVIAANPSQLNLGAFIEQRVFFYRVR